MTWEAAAGFSAVVAAAAVGIGQTMILGRQSQVAARMADIEDLKLASELYERRLEVFTAVRRVLSYAIMTGKAPGMDRNSEDMPLGVDEFHAFQQSLSAAGFLFSDSTNREIDAVYTLLARLSGANDGIRLRADPSEARFRRDEVRKEMNDKFLKLNDLFPELKLTKASGR